MELFLKLFIIKNDRDHNIAEERNKSILKIKRSNVMDKKKNEDI